jgi:hypothetical protein
MQNHSRPFNAVEWMKIKIVGKWPFIPKKDGIIGLNPFLNGSVWKLGYPISMLQNINFPCQTVLMI